jgi:WD40-like Beta Propeller Repeat
MRNPAPIMIFCIFILFSLSCKDKSISDSSGHQIQHPECVKEAPGRSDIAIPSSAVADWGNLRCLGDPVNTFCPEDAIEISRDGSTLYFLFTKDLLTNLIPSGDWGLPTGTYRALKSGGPDQFDAPVFYDLSPDIGPSIDAELSFTRDGRRVYFHSLRPSNLGFQANPPTDDYLDIYVAEVVDGVPGPAHNLGAPVNSLYPDGEHALHPDGVTLYLTSLRPGGLGGSDIWKTTLSASGDSGSTPINLGAPVNSASNDLQPEFTSDGDTMYFVSDRSMQIGSGIYRSVRSGANWAEPELVIRGNVGEPSITGDSRFLYFVHVLVDTAGIYDADIWLAEIDRQTGVHHDLNLCPQYGIGKSPLRFRYGKEDRAR